MARNLKGLRDDPTNFAKRKAMADRIVRRLAALDMSQGDLARKLKIDPATVSRWFTPERGYSMPESVTLVELPRVLQCSFRWLLTGDGSMLPEETSDTEAFREGARLAYSEIGNLCQSRIDALALGTQVSSLTTGPAAREDRAYRQMIEEADRARAAARTAARGLPTRRKEG